MPSFAKLNAAGIEREGREGGREGGGREVEKGGDQTCLHIQLVACFSVPSFSCFSRSTDAIASYRNKNRNNVSLTVQTHPHSHNTY